MRAASPHAIALQAGVLPQGINARYERENHIVWNEERRTNEEQELIYEVSWIPEISAWRRFLRSQRKTRG